VYAAVRAELLDLEAIRIVATVLARDVVAVLALLTREGDLRANVGGGHGSCLFLLLAERYESTAMAANSRALRPLGSDLLKKPHDVTA